MNPTDDIIFWQHWNKCKVLFDGMENALIKAKLLNPEKDYSESENKLNTMSDLQMYLGLIHEENTVLKRVNLQHGEQYYNLKKLFIDEVKKSDKLKEEIEQLKTNIKL